MEFILKVKVPEYSFKIDYGQSIGLWGSCFTEHIGRFLEQSLFNTAINPCGIIYNPISILEALQLSIGIKTLDENTLFEKDGIWYSWAHHSQFWGNTKTELLQKIESQTIIKVPNIMMITFGTSYAYQLKSNGKIVANCHKVPGNQFSKMLLSSNEIVGAWREEIQKLLVIQPDLKIILTVSPVRHWRDGAAENTLSKSILIQAVHELKALFPEHVFYFPAYEIVLDELRDYRFFKEDMIHPNEQAVAYVWEQFCNAFFNVSTNEILKKIQQISKAVQHKPFQKNDAYQVFKLKTMNKIQELKNSNPNLDFSRFETKLSE
jgi:hypothetical protein